MSKPRATPAPAKAPSSRALGAPQFAFARAWAEGIDPAIAWERFLYLDGAGDVRKARGELLRIRDELRRLARMHGRLDIAALLCRDPEAIVDRNAARPTLEHYSLGFEPDYYSEAELLKLYEEEHGKPSSVSSARRRQRLRERLVLAIQWLREKVARPPLPDDPATLWFDHRVASRLAAVGIRTVGELGFWVRARGLNWHRRIPRLGPEGAKRIVRWLRENEVSLGALPASCLLPASQRDISALTPAARTGIVPLERFAPARDRDGSSGTNRAPLARCKLSASNDFEAIQAWLRLRIAGSHTWRAYRKEAERLLLWAVLERRKALSSLDGDDCLAYRDFLARPGPAWLGPRYENRWSEAWRPFEGPLAARSQAAALTIVRSLCEWLVRRHYLDSNPWDDVPLRPDAPAMPQLRALSFKHWALIQAWIQAQAPAPAQRRLSFIMTFAYLTGMRLAELAAARIAWLRHEALDDGELAWSIMVLGKRNKWREVPLPDAAVLAMRTYLADRGLSAQPLDNPAETPLIAKVDSNEPLSAGRIYDVLVAGFEKCAAEVWASDRKSAERIREASTHWLRHTYGSHAVAKGVPADVVQANMGHESLATTSIYVTAEKGRRHRAVQAAFAGPGKR